MVNDSFFSCNSSSCSDLELWFWMKDNKISVRYLDLSFNIGETFLRCFVILLGNCWNVGYLYWGQNKGLEAGQK